MRSAILRLTPLRIGILVAVVTLSTSQILFQIVTAHVEEFPETARFHLGLLFWIWALPLLVLDLAIVRDDQAEGPLASIPGG